jgi:hypothetical protein
MLFWSGDNILRINTCKDVRITLQGQVCILFHGCQNSKSMAGRQYYVPQVDPMSPNECHHYVHIYQHMTSPQQIKQPVLQFSRNAEELREN